MNPFCMWCGQELSTSQHLCPQAEENVTYNKVYIVYNYLYDLDFYTINSVWKNKNKAEVRSSVLNNSYIEEHIIADWSLEDE